MHHKYTNIPMDDDVGYGMLRVTRDQRWTPSNVYRRVQHHAGGRFDRGMALQHLEIGKIQGATTATTLVRLGELRQGRASDLQGLRDVPGTDLASPWATYGSTATA